MRKDLSGLMNKKWYHYYGDGKTIFHIKWDPSIIDYNQSHLLHSLVSYHRNMDPGKQVLSVLSGFTFQELSFCITPVLENVNQQYCFVASLASMVPFNVLLFQNILSWEKIWYIQKRNVYQPLFQWFVTLHLQMDSSNFH